MSETRRGIRLNQVTNKKGERPFRRSPLILTAEHSLVFLDERGTNPPFTRTSFNLDISVLLIADDDHLVGAAERRDHFSGVARRRIHLDAGDLRRERIALAE